MAKLFLDGTFKEGSQSPSTVYISVPYPKKGSKGDPRFILRGLVEGDPTWTASNKWGPVIEDLTNIQDALSLVGSSSQFSWINASTMCWKGTNPLSINVNFYIINYSKTEHNEAGLKALISLAAIDKTEGSSMVKVKVHGGYAADVLSGNTQIWDNGTGIKNMKDNNDLSSLENDLYDSKGSALGSVTLQFGHKSRIRNLLLHKINVTESTVEVAEQDGGGPRPLYYKVSAQFTGVRPFVTTDVDDMFSLIAGSSLNGSSLNNTPVREESKSSSGYSYNKFIQTVTTQGRNAQGGPRTDEAGGLTKYAWRPPLQNK